MRLANKVAMITGAGRGIGRVTAETFSREGAQVALCDVDLPEVQALAEEIQKAGGKARAYKLDVSLAASVNEVVASIKADFGSLDVLVNNAGIIRDKQLLKLETADFDAVIDVNLKGVFLCSQSAAVVMAEQGGGVILNASSVVALYGNFGQTNYVAAKCGVIGMTKVWARELGRKGIRVNAVAPGFIETRMTEGIPEKVKEKINERIPLGRMGQPQEIANAYLWLASDESTYVTGHVLSVDGGAVT
jgi:3-oxoacyl-[acyl-carrier protein] reductase